MSQAAQNLFKKTKQDLRTPPGYPTSMQRMAPNGSGDQNAQKVFRQVPEIPDSTSDVSPGGAARSACGSGPALRPVSPINGITHLQRRPTGDGKTRVSDAEFLTKTI